MMYLPNEVIQCSIEVTIDSRDLQVSLVLDFGEYADTIEDIFHAKEQYTFNVSYAAPGTYLFNITVKHFAGSAVKQQELVITENTRPILADAEAMNGIPTYVDNLHVPGLHILESELVMLGENSIFKTYLVDGESTTCTWAFDDDQILQTTHNIPEFVTVGHSYNQPGMYITNVTCCNIIDCSGRSYQQYVKVPLIEFKPTYPFIIEFGQTAEITWTVQDNAEINMYIQLDGSSRQEINYHTGRHNITFDQYVCQGRHNVYMTVRSHPEDMLIVIASFFAQVTITGVDLKLEVEYDETNFKSLIGETGDILRELEIGKNITIVFSILGGNDVIRVWNMGDETDNVPWQIGLFVDGNHTDSYVWINGLGKSRLAPRQEYRSSQIDVTSLVTYSCRDNNTEATFTWNVTRIEKEGNYDIDIEQSTRYTITFPPKFFNYGLISISLTVDLDIPLVDPGNDTVYIDILRAPPIVEIEGGDMRTSSGQVPLILDGSKSYDPEADTEEINLVWRCRPHDSEFTVYFEACNLTSNMYIITEDNRVVTIMEEVLNVGRYIFHLILTTDENVEKYFEQEVFIIESIQPSIQIKCILNCGVNSSSLIIEAHFLDKGTTYKLEGSVCVPGKGDAKTAQHFRTATTPYGGICKILPGEGQAMTTMFIMLCQGWKTNESNAETALKDSKANSPGLYFRIQLAIGDEIYGSDFYYSQDPITPNTTLPEGPEEKDYIWDIIISVEDQYGEFNLTYLKVRVLPVEYDDDLIYDVYHKADIYKRLDNPIQAMQMVLSISTFLNKLRSDICKLMDFTTRILNTPEAVLQTASTLKIATAVPSQVERQTLDVSVRAMSRGAMAMSDMSKNTNLPQEKVLKTAEDFFFSSAFLLEAGNSTVEMATVEINSSDVGRNESSNTTQLSTEAPVKHVEDRQHMRDTTNSIVSSVSSLSDSVLRRMQPGESAVNFSSNGLAIQLERTTSENMANKTPELPSGTFALPSPEIMFGEQNYSSVDVKLVQYDRNPFIWDTTAEQVSSPIISLEIMDDNGTLIEQKNTAEDFIITMDYIEDEPELLTNISENEISNAPPKYTVFNVTFPRTAVQIIITPNNTNATYIVYLKHDLYPTDEDFDFRFVVPIDFLYSSRMDLDLGFGIGMANVSSIQQNNIPIAGNPYAVSLAPPVLGDVEITTPAPEEEPQKGPRQGYSDVSMRLSDISSWSDFSANATRSYNIFIPDKNIRKSGSYGVKIKEFLGWNYSEPTIGETVTPYTIRIHTANCRYWDTNKDRWSNEGCTVSPLSQPNHTICRCNHLTNFGIHSFYVPVNTIDWDRVQGGLANFADNALVFSVVIIIMIVYFMLLYYMRKKDKDDRIRWSATPLIDNKPLDRFLYHITVYTGHDSKAGTRSNISFKLSGSSGDTGTRHLKDQYGKVFGAGSVNQFYLTVQDSLGDLEHCYIWHDSSGLGDDSSWFLDRIIIGDMQMRKCMMWGAEKQKDWLLSCITSFAESILLMEPMKVVVLAAVVSFFVRKPDFEKYKLHESEKIDQTEISKYSSMGDTVSEGPLKGSALENIRERRVKEKKMMALLYGIIVYSMFVCVTLIRTPAHFWEWMDNNLVPNLYPDLEENETEIVTSDRMTYRVGVPRLRQHRNKKGQCLIEGIVPECEFHGVYETENYDIGWRPYNNLSVGESNNITSAWHYRGAEDLVGYDYYGNHGVYSLGGYTTFLEGNKSNLLETLSRLANNSWVDLYTRIILLEFDLYSPDADLYSSNTYAIEFLNIGSTECRATHKVFRLLKSIFDKDTIYDKYASTVFLCWIMYGFFAAFMTYSIVKRIRLQRHYFIRFAWNYFDLLLLLVTLSSLALAISYQVTAPAILKETLKVVGGNMQEVAMLSDALVHLLSVAVFLSIVRYLKLLRFNRRIMLLTMTLQAAGPALASFFFVLVVYVGAYTHAGYLLFHKSIGNFKTVYDALRYLFTIMLGKFPKPGNFDIPPGTWNIYLFVFTMSQTVIMINIFIAIINDAFTEAREKNRKQQNHFEMVDYLMARLKDKAIGIGLITEEQQSLRIPEYLDKIDRNLVRFEEVMVEVEARVDKLYSSYFTEADKTA
uniref:Uncharacterized protein LOC102808421 n=1 Tax=Saccoglossus kowalevskii TaxID=10224 RepID=A0ABM0MB11_SACKO|nr:PREDICTED: uncharacterized protein LOC102808421 [Saccoglossus kowalevskii]